jgi:hypothetical protein
MASGNSPAAMVANVPRRPGGGRIMFSQLEVPARLDRTWPNYDPVAEPVLLTLLGLDAR